MNGKQIATILAILGLVSMLCTYKSQESKSEFQVWKEKYGMKYDSVFEEAYRERVFLENVAQIKAHNASPHKTYFKAVNHLSGLTHEEFVQNYLGLNIPAEDIVGDSVDSVFAGDIDWIQAGAVTGVKDQGQCGSCWAFSATGGLEGLSKVNGGELESFSEQQLVDCSSKYGNNGCNGGLMDNAFKFVKDKGILHENDYKYIHRKGTCKNETGPYKISGFTDIKNCNDLAIHLAGRPISIAVDATNWQHYHNGTFKDCKTKLNHGVTLVGATAEFWNVKNSWGAAWGQYKGYIHLAKGNTCGLCNVASYPNK